MSADAVLLALTGGVGSCLCGLVLVYNLVAAVLFLREDTRESAGGLAKAAWALGLAALLGWWAPCLGLVLAVAALVAARVERGRIFRDEAPLAGATPVRMASVNGGIALMLQVLGVVGAVTAALGS